MRLILEPAALLLPGFAADPTLLDQLITEHGALLADPGLADLDPMRIFDLDARFHEALAGFSGNPFLRNVVRQQNALRRLLEAGSYGDKARVAAWCGEHLEILHALKRGQGARASRLLRTHLRKAAVAARAVGGM